MPIYSSTFGQMDTGIDGVAPPPPANTIKYII